MTTVVFVIENVQTITKLMDETAKKIFWSWRLFCQWAKYNSAILVFLETEIAQQKRFVISVDFIRLSSKSDYT